MAAHPSHGSLAPAFGSRPNGELASHAGDCDLLRASGDPMACCTCEAGKGREKEMVARAEMVEAATGFRSFLVGQMVTVCLPRTASVADLAFTCEMALQQVVEHGPQSLDFTGLLPRAVHPEHLAMALRCLSHWRDDVPGWHAAVEVCAEACPLRGLDPADVLFGLLPTFPSPAPVPADAARPAPTLAEVTAERDAYFTTLTTIARDELCSLAPTLARRVLRAVKHGDHRPLGTAAAP